MADRLTSLPDGGDLDYDWEEILPALTGDADVEALWSASWDGIEDPGDDTNQYLGMGDYRPVSWHRLFDREIPGSGPTGP